MRVHVYEQLMAMQASRRQVLKGAAGVAAAAAASGPLAFTAGPAYAADSVVAQIMKIPGAGNGSPTDADWQKVGELCLGPTKAICAARRIQGRQLLLHGPQQPEPAQLPVPRLPEAMGGLYRRFDQVDRSRPGRLQRAAAAVDRDRHRRFRHHRDGRAVRRRYGRQGPALRDARLGYEAGRLRRLRQLPQAAGRHLERQDPSRHHRQRLPHHEQTHRRLRRRRSRQAMGGLEGQGRLERLGAAEDLAAGAAGHQIPQGQEGQG